MTRDPSDRIHEKPLQQGGAEPAKDAIMNLNADRPRGRTEWAGPKAVILRQNLERDHSPPQSDGTDPFVKYNRHKWVEK